jgi:hypothetical protein
VQFLNTNGGGLICVTLPTAKWKKKNVEIEEICTVTFGNFTVVF